MEEIVDTFPAEEKKRTQFLTVLCVLSFIGIGWGLASGLMNFNKDADEEMAKVQESMEQMGDSEMMGKIMEGTMTMLEHQRELTIMGLICSAIALLGVIMMWQLKKKGFWIYTVAQALSLVGVFIILGVNFMSLMTIGIGGFFSILFVILYAVNLKHMS